MQKDYLNNFGMLMPTDVVRHTDGQPVMFVSPEDKEKFSKWFFENGHGDSMKLREKEKLFKQWKLQNENK